MLKNGKVKKINILNEYPNGLITWNNVDKAEYYVLRDSNSNIESVKYHNFDKLEYKPFVAGKHKIELEIYYKDSSLIEKHSIETKEVKIFYAYHATPFSSFNFGIDCLKFTKLAIDSLERNGNLYRAYYNVERGWVSKSEDSTDFSEEENLRSFFAYYKNCGFNVLSASSFTIIHSNDNWKNSKLKKYMDIAWKEFGLKVLVWDNYIFELPRKYEYSIDVIRELFISAYKKKENALYGYTHHPGFCGICLTDEPFSKKEKGCVRINQIEYVGYCYQVLKKMLGKDGISCKFTCALLKFPYIFRGEEGYIDYLEDWVKYSKSDFINFDVYLPRISDNPNRSWVVTLQQFEETYKCIRKVADKYNLRIDSAVSAFDFSNTGSKNALNQRDVLQNVYFAYMFGADTICYFACCPFGDGEIINTIFDFNGKPGHIYPWVKESIDKVKKLDELCDGYKYIKSNLTDFDDRQTVKTLWGNSNVTYIHFYINMVTSNCNTTSLVFVQENEKYYYFRNDGSIESNVADKELAFWIYSGELILIFNNKSVLC